MRRLIPRIAMTLISAASIGCGVGTFPAPETAPAITRGPHGGTAYRIGGGASYVEILNEPAVDRDSSQPTAVVAYFLGPDRQGPMAEPPSAARLEIRNGPKTGAVHLEASGPARFASATGPYALESIRGNLVCTIVGQEVTIQAVGDAR